jgi:hypothetical protein
MFPMFPINIAMNIGHIVYWEHRDERQCIWWMSSSYSVRWMIYRWETSNRYSSGGRKTDGRLCALRKLARFVGGDGARASALRLSGPLFSAHSSIFFDLDEFFILSRAFIWIFWVEIWFKSASCCGASSSRHQAIQRLQGWSKRW